MEEYTCPTPIPYDTERALQTLLQEVQKGWASAEKDGWRTLPEAEKQLAK